MVSTTAALIRFVSRSFMPATIVLSTVPRPRMRRSRSAACMFFAFPPKYASSISTGPAKFAMTWSAQVSRMRCAKCHAVFCVTPRSRCIFIELVPLSPVLTM